MTELDRKQTVRAVITYVALAGAALAVAAIFTGLNGRKAVARTLPKVVVVSSVAAIPPAVRACSGPCYIRLTPGSYGDLTLQGLAPPPGQVRIDLTGSTFSLGYVPRSSNLEIDGGTVVTGNKWGQCWVVDFSRDITLLHNTADRCGAAGFIITRSVNVALLNWTASAPLCDGVTVSGTDGFVVAWGNTSGYVPNPNGCHADGVQMWGMDGYALKNGQVLDNNIQSSEAILSDGRSKGIQGVTAFANNAPGGGGFEQDHITVTGNKMYLYGSWCVAILKTTNLVAKDNYCFQGSPRPWNSHYGWTGSSGTIGPNYMDNVAEYGR